MRIPALAAACAALFAVPARAQQDSLHVVTTVSVEADTTPRTSLQKGSWSLSFSIPALNAGAGSGELGAWEMIGARTNLGLTLGVSVLGQEGEVDGQETSQATTYVDLGVSVKQYVTQPGEVTPFLLGGVSIGGRFDRRDGLGYEETSRGISLGTRGAVGVEWFPVRRVSVSGQTGFALYATRSTMKTELPDDTTREGEGRMIQFNTFTSALSLQIWF